MIRRFRLLVVAVALLDGACGSNPSIVVLVSLDGWRWDYIDKATVPTLRALARRGVRAEGLISPFPSKTFPSHYTIVTGLYPARHGIVSNNMVDSTIPGRFSLSDRKVQADPRWWGGEPLWVTAERQGRKSGTMFWPGSDVEIAGVRPSYWKNYDGRVPNQARVDQVLEWLRLPDVRRPSLVTLYFSDVDTIGHDEGPESAEVLAAAARLDQMVERLVSGIDAAGLASRANFVIVSDHGMAALSTDRTIVLDDYLDVSAVDVVDWSPILGLAPRAGSVDQIYGKLKSGHPSLEVYRREEIPAEYRLRGHPRVPPIIGIADEGWHITSKASLQAAAKQGRQERGDHGYDPRLRSMHGLFIATGPRFREGVSVPAFENVHLYALICSILGLTPAENDGDPAVGRALLK